LLKSACVHNYLAIIGNKGHVTARATQTNLQRVKMISIWINLLAGVLFGRQNLQSLEYAVGGGGGKGCIYSHNRFLFLYWKVNNIVFNFNFDVNPFY